MATEDHKFLLIESEQSYCACLWMQDLFDNNLNFQGKSVLSRFVMNLALTLKLYWSM
jgi:hypothetical protein